MGQGNAMFTVMAKGAARAANEAGRRERILDAARKLIAEHGFEATSTKAIAAAAGVPSGLVFYYFETKDALIEAIFDENTAVISKAVARTRSGPLEVVLRAVYDELLARRYLAQIAVAAIASSHPIAQKALASRRRGLAALADYFRSQSTGNTAVDPDALAQVINASMITAVL